MASKPPALSTNFFRSVRSCRPQTHRSIRSPPAAPNRKRTLYTSSARLRQEQDYQRYGPAATPSIPPPPRPAEPFLPSTEQTQKDATEAEAQKPEGKERETQEQREPKRQHDLEESHDQSQDQAPPKEATEPHPEEIQQSQPRPNPTEASPSLPEGQSNTNPDSQRPEQPAPDEGPLPNRELDMVLSIPSPSEVKGTTSSSSSHPHLEASPYEHHFDTYSLVQDLCTPTTSAGTAATPEHEAVPPFSDAQSVTLMKAIRLMLAQNLDLAKDGLVSKSDTENETYLFRAACSELKTTMQTSRFMEAQKQRSQRAQLQHEFDILNQKVTQDIMTMREELKGMFNDRKLGLQEEKRQVDGKIQGLSYRISVDLNSEAKSEVEGLRWVLTRRAALAIGAAATMTLGFLQYYSVKAREQAEIEKKRKLERKKQDERMKREEERFGSSASSAGGSTGTQTDGIVLGGTAGSGYQESLG